MLDSLLLILPVFIIIAFGVLIDVLNMLPKQAGSILGNYVLYVALPLLMIHILANATIADVLHGGFWAGILLSMAIVYIMGYVGEFFIGRRGHGPAVTMAMASSCSNVAFMGLPVVMSLMPNNPVALVAAGLAVMSPNIVATPAIIQMEYMKGASSGEKKSLGRLLLNIVLNPLILSTLVGLVLTVIGQGLWGPLDKACNMVGKTTAPCMLLALGLDLRGKIRIACSSEKGLGLGRVSAITIIKLVIHPLLAWGLLALFGVTGTWLVVGVIMSGTATALVSYVIAEVYGYVPEEAALIAVVTNVLNLVTLTILVAALRAAGLL